MSETTVSILAGCRLLVLCCVVVGSPVAVAGSLLFHERFEDVASIRANGGVIESTGLAFVDGISGKAADFAGNRRVCYPMAGRINVDVGTAHFWVKTPAANGFGLFDIGTLGNPNSWGIFKNVDHIIMEVKSFENRYDQAWSPGPVRPDGAWHFISAVWNREGATTYFKVCVDGVCKSTFDGITADSRPNPNGSMCVGWSGWYGYSQSQVDELKIFDFAKSDAEIRDDYCRAPETGATVELLEYHHAEFDHYFVTGSADEINKLNCGAFEGWTRTGYRFKGYPSGGSSGSPVCRFFSASFAPKSSHFYTPFETECAIVKGNPDWQFEGEAFNIPVPNTDGTCPAGTSPVYRLYNNGQGAAPNHRYTTDAGVRSQMLARNWIAEGYGASGVIMCAPN